MISLNVVSHKSIWQPLLPCKYQNPVADGRRGAWGQTGWAVPGKPLPSLQQSFHFLLSVLKGLNFPPESLVSFQPKADFALLHSN